jgi:hypothetical protein
MMGTQMEVFRYGELLLLELDVNDYNFKKNVNFALEQAMKAQRLSRDIGLLFL